MQWPLIISWGIVNGIGNIGAAQYVTRFYSSKDENTARACQGITPIVMLLAFIPLMLIALSASILIPGIQDAVSYTHLDVYKRQALFCSRTIPNRFRLIRFAAKCAISAAG